LLTQRHAPIWHRNRESVASEWSRLFPEFSARNRRDVVSEAGGSRPGVGGHEGDGEAEAGGFADGGDAAAGLDGVPGRADQLGAEAVDGQVEVLDVEHETPEPGRTRRLADALDHLDDQPAQTMEALADLPHL